MAKSLIVNSSPLRLSREQGLLADFAVGLALFVVILCRRVSKTIPSSRGGYKEFRGFNENREHSDAILPIFSKKANGQWLIANGLMYRAKRDTYPPSCASASLHEGFCPSDRRGAKHRELSLGASPGVPLRHTSGHCHALFRYR